MMGEGALRYLGGWPSATLWDRIVSEACDELGIATERLTAGLRIRDTETHRFVFNYSAMPLEYHGQTVEPAGVLWIALSET